MKIYIQVFLFLFFYSYSNSQNLSGDYIRAFKDIAINEMKIYNIPASITLSQGILESAHGTSELASENNNHFGIKCHSNWDGETVYLDDDKNKEWSLNDSLAEEYFLKHSFFLSSSR